MEKDEIKTTEQPAANAGQTENIQSVETVETPDTATGGRADVERPDAPRDGEGFEAVTVVIIASDEKQGELMARSVKQNLVGVDADIHLVTGEHLKDTEVDTLLEHLPHVETERIVLMTEGMVILNPVTLHDIAVPKAKYVKIADGAVQDYDGVKAPVMFYKSALQQLLPYIKDYLSHGSIADEYFSRVYQGILPLNVEGWQSEPFVLPIVSSNPPRAALDEYGRWKKFAWIAPQSWTDTVVKFLEERFPE